MRALTHLCALAFLEFLSFMFRAFVVYFFPIKFSGHMFTFFVYTTTTLPFTITNTTTFLQYALSRCHFPANNN